MTTLRVVLSDQLSLDINSLRDADKKQDIIFMGELLADFTYVKHHKKKLVFMLATMRHFAKLLKQQGYSLHYIELFSKASLEPLSTLLTNVVKQKKIQQLIITMPSDYRLLQELKLLEQQCPKLVVTIKEDNRFLSTIEEFKQWAEPKKQLRMEYFYRNMRKQYNILMDGNEPVGGKWNYDASNRKPPNSEVIIPKPYSAKIDTITKEAIELVEKKFPDHFGDIIPFYFAINRKQALAALNLFITEKLPYFGDYQDAMVENEPWMFHSHLSFYLNCGLLMPLECIQMAEAAYHMQAAPLNAVEGFIRQILGWREYVRGIYWLKMPDYKEENYLQATANLPEFYWNADTKMNCLQQCVLETKNNAYAHHIQRLMVLGNFALLAGIAPNQVNEWFLIVYADAYEWVELPNVSGMILFADGGYLASKPYAAGGSYINKMSNYCSGCAYKVNEKHGKDACPFNYLYWDFLARNKKLLANNSRLRMMYSMLAKMSPAKQKQIKIDANKFLSQLCS